MRMKTRALLAVGVAVVLCGDGARAGGISVGNLVWNDIDADGIQDAGEPGIAGVTVQLWHAANNQLIASAETNSNGVYTLTAPGPGDFRVRVLRPLQTDAFTEKDAGNSDLLDSDFIASGAANALGFTDAFVLQPNVIAVTHFDAGLLRAPISVTGRVWNDYDGNGLRDPDEPGLAGVTAQITNVAKSLVMSSDSSDINGNFGLLAPGPGPFRVRIVPVGSSGFSPRDVGVDDALDSEIHPDGANVSYSDSLSTPTPITSIGAAMQPDPISIGNFVWNDLDKDGIQDPGEPGVTGVTMQLWNPDATLLLGTTSTDDGGSYTLVAPGFGRYRVRMLPPPMFAIAPLDATVNESDNDVIPIGLNAGYTNLLIYGTSVVSTNDVDGGLVSTRVFRDSFE